MNFLLLLCFSITCYSADTRYNPNGNEQIRITTLHKDSSNNSAVEIENINFYFENSASMNGYLNGELFLQNIHRVIANVDKNKLTSFFVNTAEHKVDNILQKIDSKNIKIGNTSNSDHQFIFTNAIKNAKGNSLSIVVTDGIYSVDGKKPSIVAIDIEKVFKEALLENEIETVIIKLSSEFNGTYYSESCSPGNKAIQIKQDRPYYIILFGSSPAVKKALKEVVNTDELLGFKEKAVFFITKNKDANYAVLTKGEELHGTIEPTVKFKKDELRDINAERFSVKGWFSSTPPEENYLQFGIAVNYSNYQLPNSYLIDTANYLVDDVTGYKTVEIKRISELKKNTRTYNELVKLNNTYTHIIVVKGITNLYGNLEIELKNNLPTWIKDTGLEDDSEIKDNINQTFAFDQLIKGISDAYKKINKKVEYLKLDIKIKTL